MTTDAPTPDAPRPDADASESSDGVLRIETRHAIWAGGILAIAALAIALGTGLVSMPAVPELDPSASFWLVFVAGLSVGGLSCVAVQGGLLATVIAQQARHMQERGIEPTDGQRFLPVLQFLGAKLVAYTLLGAVLGFFGSKIPLRLQGWLLIGVGLFMVIVVLQMFDVHPFFRRFAFQPPKRIQRYLRSTAKEGSSRGPYVLGAMTIFVPCGVTLAMEGLAMASESASRGAMIMFAFTLGTMPLFLVIGFLATRLSQSAFRWFQPIAAAVIVVVAFFSITGGMRLLGVSFGAGGGEAQTAAVVQDSGSAPTLQEVEIDVLTTEYTPNNIQIAAGVPTRLTLRTEGTQGCIRAFTVPSLGIETILPETGVEVIDLPPIEEEGDVLFTCSMGMYSGVLQVMR